MVCSHGVVPCSSALLSVLLLVLIVTMTTGQILRNEKPCLSKGGICVEEDSCTEENRLNETGLCPEQEIEGAVCCDKLPQVKTCSDRGGRCGQEEDCRNVQNFGELDCTDGYECCLLIY